MDKSTIIAVDLAKSVFEVAVSQKPGTVSAYHRLERSQLLEFFVRQPPATVLFEACGSAHHWARKLQALGHRTLLLPAHLTRRYRPRNKTDRADTKALLEAHRNDEVLPVPVKTLAQHDLTALHCLRSTLVAERTARANLLRGVLREQGIVLQIGTGNAVAGALELAADVESGLSDTLRFVLYDLADEIRTLEERVGNVEARLANIAKNHPLVQTLLSVPGIGLITATAVVAFVGCLQRFPSGRHFASYLGITPREHSSGAVRRLGAISKRGDPYLRMLLIHGGRSALLAAARRKTPDRFSAWAVALAARVGHNKAAVAVANKLARYAWAVAVKGTRFKSHALAA
jgi:transposase